MSDKKGLPKVKVDCFAVKIQAYKEQNGNTRNVGFDFFPKKDDGDDSKEIGHDFIEFFKAFANNFGDKFAVYQSTNRALFVDSSKLKFSREKRTICGTVEGGTTNLGGQFKQKDNTTDEDAIPISPKHVDAQPYYFLLWLPNDKPFGYLIIQSFSSKSITDTFCTHLSRFVSKNFYKVGISFSKKVPQKFAEEVKMKSSVNSITLRKKNVNPEIVAKLLGLDRLSHDGVTFEFTIKGIKKIGALKSMVEEIENNPELEILDTKELRKIGFNGLFETSVVFDDNGNKNTSKSSKSYEFIPRIYLDEWDFERDSHELPTYESLDIYCKNLLNILIEEYSTKI